MKDGWYFAGFGALAVFIVGMIAGWVNHIIYCFTHHEYVLLLVGAIIAPIGSLHGIGLFFGWW